MELEYKVMNLCKRLVFLGIVVFATVSLWGSVASVQVTQSGSASGSCTSNVQTPAFFNNSANWGSGATQIGPGTVVLFCGTFTGTAGQTGFTFQGSGTAGSPITLQFDTGAQMTAPYWGSAISCSGKSYVTVNGGTNGSITNTANGTSLANQSTSFGVNFNSCPNSVIENLKISNLYVNQGSSSSASDINGQSTACIEMSGTSTSSTVTRNTVSQCKIGIQVSTDPGGDASNAVISNNNISDMDWGIQLGGGDSGDTATGVQIKGNTITNWTNWQYPISTYHTDGIILYNQAATSTITASIYNNYIYGSLGTATSSPTAYVFCSTDTTCTIFNNLFVEPDIYSVPFWAGSGTGNHALYNNTFIGPASIVLGMTTTLGPVTMENNIISGAGTGISDYYNLATDVKTSNYNVWVNSSGGAPQFSANDGSSYYTYSQWQALGGYDANSSTTSQSFTSSYTLNSGSSAASIGANEMGLGMTALDTDKAGNGRPATGAWSSGAYQYGGAAPAAPLPPTNVSVVVVPGS